MSQLDDAALEARGAQVQEQIRAGRTCEECRARPAEQALLELDGAARFLDANCLRGLVIERQMAAVAGAPDVEHSSFIVVTP